jgi:hypothetical protein
MSPAKRPVQSKEQFVSAYLSVSSTKCQVRSKEQLVSAYMSMFPVKCQVRSQEQLAPISCCVSLGQVASSIQRTACTCLFVARSFYLDVYKSLGGVTQPVDSGSIVLHS